MMNFNNSFINIQTTFFKMSLTEIKCWTWHQCNVVYFDRHGLSIVSIVIVF